MVGLFVSQAAIVPVDLRQQKAREMRTFFCKSITAAILVLTCAGTFPACADDAQPDLDKIAERLADWRAAFFNLQVAWEIRSLPQSDVEVVDWSSPPEPESAPLSRREEWIWTDYGLELIECRSFFWTEDAVGIHTIGIFNGPKGTSFRALFRRPPDSNEKLQELALGSGERLPVSLAPLKGLHWHETETWLPEILTSWKWKTEGFEEVCGEPCVRISGNNPGSTDVASAHILWLDLNHDCLIRRYQRPTKGGFDFIVDEFQKLENRIWFPKRGRIQLNSTPFENQLFVVTDVHVNRSLDMARFEPPVPEKGTVVIGNDRGKSSQNAVANPSTTLNPLKTAPPASNWPWWLGAMLCLSIAIILLSFRSKTTFKK